MRIGVSLRSAYPPGAGRDGARWMIERAAAARAAGLDSLFVGDHHVTGAAYYQNTPMMGRLLAEWGDAPAAVLFLMPLWPAAPSLTLAQAEQQLALYREGCAEHGRPTGVAAIRSDVHVGADGDDARRVAGPVVDRGYRGFDPEALVIGGVAEVAERFSQ